MKPVRNETILTLALLFLTLIPTANAAGGEERGGRIGVAPTRAVGGPLVSEPGAPGEDPAPADSLRAPVPLQGTAVSVQIPFQGYLTNGSTPVNGTLAVIDARLYGAATGGSPLYSESFSNVAATDGVFTLVLGSTASLSATLFSGSPLYLGLAVNGEAELPRTQLLASPFAIRAAEADHAASADAVATGAWSQTGGNVFRATGNVGIGQSAPGKRLDVTGDQRLASNSDVNTTIGSGILTLQNTAGTAGMMLDQNEIQVIGDDLYLNNDNASPTHVNGAAHFTTTGRVGLGTQAPEGRIGIENQGGTDGLNLLNFSEDENPEFYFRSGFAGTGATGNNLGLGTFWTTGPMMLWRGDGKVGVGRQSGLTARLDVLHSGTTLNDVAAKFENTAAAGIALDAKCTSSDAVAVIEQFGTGDIMRGFNGGGSPVFRVTQTGRTITPVLEITGGSDLVEPFETTGASPEPGTVLVIDAAHAGRLAPASRGYDRRVAGVVSGAGGVEPGIRMSQSGALGGDTPVAMTGRVYVRCSAENGAIEPGDLLTTADTPGHAMRVTDHDRALGAVIGKAMGSLSDGTGLVLVLVNLQ